MRLDTSMHQRMSQHQILAPRMIQSMEILQLPIMDLQARIRQELDENPALELTEPTRQWREAFARGLFHFQRRQFDAAETQFKLASKLRSESMTMPTTAMSFFTDDGPSQFYLAKIEVLRKQPLPSDWNGEVELMEK